LNDVTGQHLPRKAFTLVELLIVMAILAVVAVLAVPTASRVWAVTRRQLCRENLRQLGTAYFIRKGLDAQRGLSDEGANVFQSRVTAQPIGADAVVYSDVFGLDNWGQVLRASMGLSGRALQCPSMVPIGSEAVRHGVFPDIRLRVWGSGGAECSDYEIYVTGAFSYWDYGPASRWEDQPGIWKMNAAPLAEDYPEWRDNTDRLPEYVSSEDPDTWWYLLETARYGDDYHAGGDLDYNDVVLKVTETADQLIIEPFQLYGWAGQTYNLVCADTGQVFGDTTHSVGRDEEALGPFAFNKMAVSYGLNSRAMIFGGGAHRVLMLDYKHRACHVGPDTRDPDAWDTLQAPRHLGEANVLFSDGAVDSHRPEEIDPRQSEAVYKLYWAATGEP